TDSCHAFFKPLGPNFTKFQVFGLRLHLQDEFIIQYVFWRGNYQ
ncbi:MAG: hypothetical protein ACI9M3_002083, partial [Bacteroidia bacterium]